MFIFVLQYGFCLMYMPMSIAYCLPAHISPELFLQEYWQKKPLLIKNGLPKLANLFIPEDVLELAQEEEVLARLITQTTNPKTQKDQWKVKNSPLHANDFKKLPTHWTVLIQNLEAWSHDLGVLWQAFDFIPKWQQDDIMVSYAPDGASVGQHYDEYDVFLAQGYGKRRWQLGKFCDENTAFVANQPIRLLDDMGEIIFDEILQAGDVLYVPPKLAHYGVAVGDSLTFSFGFRRPNWVQILDKIADVATHQKSLFSPIFLQQLPQKSHLLSDDSLQQIKQQLLHLLQSPDMDKTINHAICELVSRRQYEPLGFFDELDGSAIVEALQDGAVLNINHASRFVLYQDRWYINGEPVILDETALQLLQSLLNGACITQKDLAPLNPDTLADWVNNGWLSIN